MEKDLKKSSCNYYNSEKCLSCSEINLRENQLRINTDNTIRDILSAINYKNNNTCILPLVIPESIFPSRSKAKLSVSGSVEEPIIGLLDKEFLGIELLNCPLHFPCINELLNYLIPIVKKYKLTPYDINNKKGELKGIIINCNQSQTEMMLRFILRSKEAVDRIKQAILELQTDFKNLKVISANIQPIPHQILEGSEEIILTKEKYIYESYNNIKLAFSPQCFSQVTPEIAAKLYFYVHELIKKKKARFVIDLFCGVGGFSLSCANSVEKILGIELSQFAIEAAKESAIRNNITNSDFFATSSDSFQDLTNNFPADTIICNPPRAGLSTQLIKRLLEKDFQHIIYSSCNISTLTRDLALLSSKYDILSLAPFAMFPLTKHLEIVAELES